MSVDWPDEETLRRWYSEDELSLRDIADRLGTNRRDVFTVLDFIGVDRRTEGAGADAVQWPDAETLEAWHHEDSVSLEAIADRLECHPKSVRQKFDRQGIDVRGEFSYTPKQKVAKIRRDYASGGYTYTELAKKYDMTAPGIGSIVRGQTRTDAPGPIKGEDYE